MLPRQGRGQSNVMFLPYAQMLLRKDRCFNWALPALQGVSCFAAGRAEMIRTGVVPLSVAATAHRCLWKALKERCRSLDVVAIVPSRTEPDPCSDDPPETGPWHPARSNWETTVHRVEEVSDFGRLPDEGALDACCPPSDRPPPASVAGSPSRAPSDASPDSSSSPRTPSATGSTSARSPLDPGSPLSSTSRWRAPLLAAGENFPFVADEKVTARRPRTGRGG